MQNKFDLQHITPYIVASKMMLGAVIAFIIYNAFHLQFGYWSVVTVAAITQANFAQTATKGLMRAIGTVVGAAAGYFFAVLAQGNEIVILALFFVFLTLTVLVAVQKTKFSYAGVIGGLTLVIVVSSALVTKDLFGSAVFRSFEIILGVLVMVVINLLMTLGLRLSSGRPAELLRDLNHLPHQLKQLTINKTYVNTAIKISLCCVFTFGIWLYFKQQGGFWATVSCLLIMEESAKQTQIKSVLRFVAHLIFAVAATISVLLIGDNVWWLLLPLAILFFICGYIVGTRSKYSSLGTTGGIAVAVMLLADPGTTASLHVVLARFLNVMFGVTVAILASHFFWPRKKVLT